MPPANVLSKTAYDSLRDDIAALIADARTRAQMALSRALVSAYWQVGKRIAREKLASGAGYHNAILKNLADDLDLNPRTLQLCQAFYRTYKTPPPPSRLGWSHFRELLRLRDPAERSFYQQYALHRSLTAKQLSSAIAADRYTQSRAQPDPGGSPAALRLPRPTNARYTYKARVVNVVDADTLLLHVDLGLEVCKMQRIRLAHIDVPALSTPEGKTARDHVQQQLARTDFVMVHTKRADVHGRYVGHIFYALRPLSAEDTLIKGNYLNQELLDLGLAQPL